MYDKLSQDVVFAKSEVKTVWRRNFSELATDTSEVSRDGSKWDIEAGYPLPGVLRSD